MAPAALVLVSPEALSGKTTVAAGLAQKLRRSGTGFSLVRLGGGDNAEADGTLFQRLQQGPAQPSASLILLEAPAGDLAAALSAAGEARALVVTPAHLSPDDVSSYIAGQKDRVAGIVVNRVPRRRQEALRATYKQAGIEPLAMVPEDRLLAAPTLREVAEALEARAEFLNGNAVRPLERPLIASIAADPGQAYFSRYAPTAVIVRSDKPDLQLAALNAGVGCLIVTGGLPVLSYVMDRVEEEEIPILRTDLETTAAVERIESLYATRPFAGGEAKLRRIAELLEELDIGTLL